MAETTIQPLNADPKRQANDSLRGYRYQILHSVHAWLGLADDETLYLEGAEDFDIISPETITAVQVKDTQHNITLRSQEVNDAINHYWELRINNPNLRVEFCFRTRSQRGVEQDNPFGKNQRGLDLWSDCSDNEETIKKISEFLQTTGKISQEVATFLEKAEPQQIYEQLIEPIAWETGSEEASSVERSIREKLVLHGNQQNVRSYDATKVVDHLLEEALMVATQKENRELTKARFIEIFDDKTAHRVPNQQWQQYQQVLATMMNTVSASFLGSSSDITIQFQSPIQTAIPPLYRDVVPRRELLASIQDILQSESIAVIQGGAGRGKNNPRQIDCKYYKRFMVLAGLNK